MELKQFTYLFIVFVFSLVVWIARPKKPDWYKDIFKYMVPAIFFSFIVYVMWSNRFAQIGVWSFNPEFISGIYFWSLPLEEWIFLIVLSFVSVIVYVRMKIKFSYVGKPNVFLTFSLILLVIFALTAFILRHKLYPFFTFFLLTIYFGYTIFRNRFKKHFAEFYITYIIVMLPVYFIKAVMASLPVIIYNSSAILGVHIINVPIEDFPYYFLLVLMNITIFEYLNERRFY